MTARGKKSAARNLPLLFGGTLFVSAALLFLIQPMIAKMILPKFGGTPAVWNTCMVFFQAALLAGYAYAHASTSRFGVRRQAGVHVALLATGVLLLPLLSVPLSGSGAPPAQRSPALWLLGLLLVSIGYPFFLVSATAPLLQKWFSSLGHSSGKDPYYLYAASNLGSLVGLLGYPFLFEPSFQLSTQSWLWAAGYGVLFLLVAACAVALWRSPIARVPDQPEVSATMAPAAPLNRQRLHWLALAFVPSSLMLGVTTFLSTDVAPVPLIWVLPLSLYLVSFILTFSRLPSWIHRLMVMALPLLVLIQAYVMLSYSAQAITTQVGLHLLLFFVAAMVCHGELARTRPSAEHLTEFYLWMSAGGVLGGMFNALLAPLVFRVPIEYPLAMVMTCLLMPSRSTATTLQSRLLDVILPAMLGALMAILLFWLGIEEGDPALKWFESQLQASESFLGLQEIHTSHGWLLKAMQYGLPCLLCLLFMWRPVRFGLGVGALMLASATYQLVLQQNVLHRERTFFGVVRVEAGADRRLASHGNYLCLHHGGILHGMQRSDFLRQPVPNSEPLTYYHRLGPIGHVFQALRVTRDTSPVALIGLGTGSLAYYGRPQQEVTFYEIDPAVERIAYEYFTFLKDSENRGVQLKVELGDARLQLAQAPPSHFGLIVVDAFSSDAIPVHLITREALAMYLDKLTEDGILAFHVSNRYVDLVPVLANLAADAHLVGLFQQDGTIAQLGKFGSAWVILSRPRLNAEDLAMLAIAPTANFPATFPWAAWKLYRPTPFALLARESRWTRQPFLGRPEVGVWTDHYSNLRSVLRWDALKAGL